MTELVLGTVQFGLDYGVTNRAGQLADDIVTAILDIAVDAGIRTLDTAADYGSSQVRLGDLRAADRFAFITKFSLPGSGTPVTADRIYRQSMHTLGASRLDGVLFHRPSDLRDGRAGQAVEMLRAGVAAGEIERIGVSVYSVEELETALEVFPDVSLIQIPANALDSDLLNSSVVSDLRAKGTTVHVRSVFLQGLLLSAPAELPDYFAPLVPALDALATLARDTGASVLELLLGGMRAHPSVDAVLFGATSWLEARQVTNAWAQSETVKPFILPDVPRELLDPRGWPSVRLSS